MQAVLENQSPVGCSNERAFKKMRGLLVLAYHMIEDSAEVEGIEATAKCSTMRSSRPAIGVTTTTDSAPQPHLAPDGAHDAAACRSQILRRRRASAGLPPRLAPGRSRRRCTAPVGQRER